MLLPIDRDLQPRILRHLSRSWLWKYTFFLSVLIGLSLSVSLADWMWFGRFGSLGTIAGLMLVMSPIFREGIYRHKHESSNRFRDSLDSDNQFQVSLVTIPGKGTFEHFDTDTVEDNRATLYGVAFSIVGTVIWGFGDLLGKVFGY